MVQSMNMMLLGLDQQGVAQTWLFIDLAGFARRPARTPASAGMHG